MKRPIVAFDETGNTGQNLLDPSQPVFVLASVNLNCDETRTLIDILSPENGQEFRFAKFRKNASGRVRVLKCLKSELILPEKVKLSVFHKKFMVVTKIVDLLIENLCYKTGFDLYRKGANIALSNLYYTCIPSFCGKGNFEAFLQRFVNMIRSKDNHSIKAFYDNVEKLRTTCTEEEFKEDIDLIISTRLIVNEVLHRTDISALDPAIPGFVHDCAMWSEELGCEFDVVHDQSKPIEHYEEILSYLMAKDEPEAVVGYDRRKMKFPLKATGIKLCDSRQVPQIQIADLIASAYGYWLKGGLGMRVDKRFLAALNDSRITGFLVHPVWPSDKVTPADLGTDREGGTDPNLYVGALIGRQRKKRRKNTNW
jgi:hypothetical protein